MDTFGEQPEQDVMRQVGDASPPTPSASIICNYPFGTHCTATTNCNLACSPNGGYCPEYTAAEVDACDYDANNNPCGSAAYKQPSGCLNCQPNFHYCFPGEPF